MNRTMKFRRAISLQRTKALVARLYRTAGAQVSSEKWRPGLATRRFCTTLGPDPSERPMHRSNAILFLAACANPPKSDEAPSTSTDLGEPVDLVAAIAPVIATGGTGYNVGCAYPGASVPFGLAKPSPDTSTAAGSAFGAYHGGGYHADDSHIQGFSQLHLHGVGLTDYGLISLMPVDGMTDAKTTEDGYRVPFSHADEHAEAGLYTVRLDDPGVSVALSTDGYAAVHRYTFDADVEAPVILVDLGHRMDGSEVLSAALELDPTTGSVQGWMHQDGAMASRDFTTWFDLEVSAVPVAWGTWEEDGVLLADATSASADREEQGVDSVRVGVWLQFDIPEVTARVGVSLTDAEGAATARTTDAPLDVDATASAARAEWEEALAGVRVWGGTPEQQVVFATALYHSLQMPTRMSDRDGRYRGFDGQPHDNPGHAYYSDFSLWDTYRTTHPLYTELWPAHHREMLRSWARMVEEGGAIPKWPLATWDPGFMVGSPGHIVVGEALLKGLDAGGDFEADILLENAVDVALGRLTPPYAARPDPIQYGELGFWPSDTSGRMVAWQLEVALADYALAQSLALRLDASAADVAELERRAAFWRNVFNPSTGWMQGRSADGSWIPLSSEDGWEDIYTEGNARQYVWMVPHDPEALFEEMGGDDIAIERLIEFFDNAVIDAEDDISGLPEEWYWHGNEIDLHAPWMAALAGRPDLTRAHVAWVLDRWYGTGPDGLAGNDDGGTLSAWAVWASFGVYPLAGTDRYVLGWPVFDQVQLTREDGSVLTIQRSGDGLAEGATVTVSLDGEFVDGPALTHDQWATATTLRFEAE